MKLIQSFKQGKEPGMNLQRRKQNLEEIVCHKWHELYLCQKKWKIITAFMGT